MGNQTVWAVPIVSDVKPFDPSLLSHIINRIAVVRKAAYIYQALNDPLPFMDEEEKVISLKQSVNNRTFLRTVGGKKCSLMPTKSLYDGAILT